MKQTTRLKSSRGTSTVEMAALLPVLVLLTLGVVDLGRVFYEAVLVSNAARAGLSYGSLSAAKAEETSISHALGHSDGADNGGVNVSATRVCECAGGSVVNCDTGTCGGTPPRVYVRVHAWKTFNTTFPYPGIPDTVNLSRVFYMRAR